MAFETLLGNDRLKQNLRSSLEKKHISHFYLISGPEGSGKHTLARLLAEAILCEGGLGCGSCVHCRKLRSGNHPDFITVEDPEHKNVAVKIVRQIREDMFVRPNEAAHKIYLFPQELGLEGQNALLKILEEPPAYGVFLLLTDNPDKLLPTVRSRCTELKMQALDTETIRNQLRLDFPKAEEADITAAIFRSGSFLGQARKLLEAGGELPPQTEQFVRAFGERDSLLLTQTLVPMEKWKRDALAEIMAEKPFHEISVTEVCKKASVSKNTFYRHFENLSDVIYQSISEINEKLVEEAFSFSSHQVDDFIIHVCNGWYENRRLYKGFTQDETIYIIRNMTRKDIVYFFEKKHDFWLDFFFKVHYNVIVTIRKQLLLWLSW